MNTRCIAHSEKPHHQEECDLLLLHRSPTHSGFVGDSDDEGHPENAVRAALKPTLAANRRLRNRGCFRGFPFPISSRLLRPALRVLRYLPIVILSTMLSLLIVVVIYGGVPPSYRDVRTRERALPQHRWEVSCPWGRMSMRQGCHAGAPDEDGRYFLRFPDHVWGHGLNNVLQEAILTTHLALTSHLPSNENSNPELSPPLRTPVFEDYAWSHFPLPWTLYDFKLRQTRVPLGAYLSGVLAGGDWTNEPRTPEDERNAPGRRTGTTGSSAVNPLNQQRAVSAEYFEFVCPPSKRVEIVYGWPWEDPLAGPQPDASATEIVSWWRKRLQQDDVRDERCVVVRERRRRIFDSGFFGTSNIFSIFEKELRVSPVITHFEWAPIVPRAVLRTVRRFWGVDAASHLDPSSSSNSSPHSPSSSSDSHPPLNSGTSQTVSTPSPPMIPSLLAVHLRRGDYKRHCKRLASWGSPYMGLNAGLATDRFEWVDDVRSSGGLEGGDGNFTTAEQRKEAYYLEHCLPTIPQIVKRLGEVREEYEHDLSKFSSGASLLSRQRSGNATMTATQDYTLKHVYVLTNGWPRFLQELRDKLKDDGWETVFGTSDLEEAGDRSKESTDPDYLRGGLTKEEKDVSVAVDMGLAESAEVFVGNGFSSLSANVVMLRTARGFKTMSNRML